jgi:hypothetical protein
MGPRRVTVAVRGSDLVSRVPGVPGADYCCSLVIEIHDVFGGCRGENVDYLRALALPFRVADVCLPAVGELSQLSGRVDVGAGSLAAQEATVTFELLPGLGKAVEIVGPAELYA